jgi:ABC-2 type transport system permease protein
VVELFLAELKRSWIQFKRYPAEAISGIIIFAAVFYGLFLSASYIAGPGLQLGDRLDSIIVGYVLWTLATFILFDVAGTIQNEAQTGTLEQIFITPFSTRRVLLFRAIASLLIQLILIMVILLIIMALTGRWLSFPITLLFPLVTLILAGYGLSFTLGSLALVLKRVQQLLGISQFVLLFLLTVPTETWTGSLKAIGYLLPMTISAGLLRDVMARQQSLDLPTLGFAVLNGIVYFAIGLTFFRWAERETKRRGKLGGY